MTDIEKAQFAVEMICHLLRIKQKLQAIALTQKLFKSSLQDAKNLVDFIESVKKTLLSKDNYGQLVQKNRRVEEE